MVARTDNLKTDYAAGGHGEETTHDDDRGFVYREKKNAVSGRVLVTRTLLLHKKRYSIPEAAKLINVSKTNLRAIIRAGRIPVFSLTGTKLLLLESDLEKFLHDNYGPMQEAQTQDPEQTLKPLPKDVEESDFVRRLRE